MLFRGLSPKFCFKTITVRATWLQFQTGEATAKPENIGHNAYTMIKKLKHSELYALCRELSLDAKASTKKAELFDLVLCHYVDENVVPESYLEDDDTQGELFTELDPRVTEAKAKAEAIKRESEAEAKAKAEAIKLEVEARIKIEDAKAQAELIRARAEASEIEARAQAMSRNPSSHSTPNVASFDPTRHVRFVPVFQDRDIDAFFQAFEQNAVDLSWPQDKWVLLLSTALKGKAQVAYSVLSGEDRANYSKVKEAILKAYEMVPEAYRQKFRKLTRHESQSHVEFLKEKERHFDKWCKSREVADFSGLRRLMLKISRIMLAKMSAYILTTLM